MLQKISNYQSAFVQLSAAVDAYTAAPADTLYRDGLIQRFEFTFELAWKSLKEYMEDQGVTEDLQFPKQVLKTAYAAGVLADEIGWLDMLAARNRTSHVYDEATAQSIAHRICADFLPLLRALAAFYG